MYQGGTCNIRIKITVMMVDNARRMRHIATLVFIASLVSSLYITCLKVNHDRHNVPKPGPPPASHSESELSFDSSLFQTDIVPTWDLEYYYGADVVEELVAQGLIDGKDEDSKETPIISMRLSSSSSSKHKRWTTMMKNDYYMINVYIDREQYSLARRQLIKDILKNIAKKTQVIRFRFYRNKPSEGRPYLWYGHHGTNSCASYVGKRSSAKDGQKIWIGSKCFDELGIIEHETLHALGFYHEQSRPDRDDYIDVRNENIMPGKEVNFAKLSKDAVLNLGRPYDYDSVLHYGNNFFSKNTFETIDSRGYSIGQRDAMSIGDILQTRLMYQCSDGNERTYDEYNQHTCTSTCKCGNRMKGCGDNDSLCKDKLRCVDNKCTWKKNKNTRF